MIGVKAVRPRFLGTSSRPKSQSRARMSRSKLVKLFRHGGMKAACRISLLAIGLAPLLGAGVAAAGALVEFPNLPERAPRLLGYLARPDSGLSAELDESRPYGGGPFPAVVVLHGCIGMTGHFTGIADRLSSWGYVVLAVDSLGPRGITDRCGVGSREQPLDAYAALHYLSQLDFVDPARVALLGESLGGESALAAVERDMAAQYFAERFRAVIVYYPNCVIPAPKMTAPTLILIGEVDEASPVEPCREMVAHARPDGLAGDSGLFLDLDRA